MKRGLKGFAFLVSGLVLGIIGATASVTAIALSAVGMAKGAPCQQVKQRRNEHEPRRDPVPCRSYPAEAGGYLAPDPAAV